MIIYYLLLAASAGAGIPLCSKKCGKWGKAVYCIAFALIFTVISAARFEVGYDYNLYGNTYFKMKYLDLEDLAGDRMEKGFLLPLYFLDLGYESYYTVFIYTSIIIYFSVFALIYFRSSNPWISAAAFLCFGSFFNSLCFLRQFMASLIVVYAMKYLKDKSPLKFFILIMAASVFHWSALIMLGLYFLLKIKPSWIYLGITAFLTVLFCIFSRSMMMWFIDNFYMYKGYNPDTNPEASIGLSPKYTIIFGIIFIVCFLFRKRLIEKDPQNKYYINCMMFTVVFEAMGMRHAILSRFALLTFLAPVICLFPDAVKVIAEFASEKKGKAMKIVSFAASAVYAAAVYTILISGNYNGTVPYVSQFNRPYEIFVEKKITEDSDSFYDQSYFNDDDFYEDYDEEDYEGWEADDEEIIIDDIIIN